MYQGTRSLVSRAARAARRLLRAQAPLGLDALLARARGGPRLLPRRRPVGALLQLVAQPLQRLAEVARARALVLALGGHARGTVDEPHRGLGLVAVLASGAAGAVHLHLAEREQIRIGKLVP